MSQAVTEYDADKQQLFCRGAWDLAHLPNLQALFSSLPWPKTGVMTIDGSDIAKMDSAGAWLLNIQLNQLKQWGVAVTLKSFQDRYLTLVNIVEQRVKEETGLPVAAQDPFLMRVGKSACAQLNEFMQYLAFVGLLSLEALRLMRKTHHVRWGAFSAVIYRTGFQALPIVALLSFMIGVVITYQMGLQLKNYGANIYIVDLLGLSILREFGPLLTAIMIAGRTGSAFTAQLGMMKLNQEIDALDTMGITPSELLLLPRIVGLLIALPLLTIWSDIFGVFGGMVMSHDMLSITWYDFLHRFPSVIPLRTLLIGLGKSPVFALIIASIGCYQGVQVKGSADSVGQNTTRSVVMAIFFIIVADAIFSIIFSKLKL